MSHLETALEKAYSAFSWRRLERPLEACHCACCMSKEMAESILETPLRQLSNEQLSEYTNSAHEWSDQFLYLLPRYMDLISHGERPTYLDADHIFSRFAYAPENCLTPSETSAFDEWFSALFEEILCRLISTDELACALTSQWTPYWKGFGSDVCEIVEMAMPSPFDTVRLRQVWENCQTREANLRLASVLIFGIGAEKFRSSRFLTARAKGQAGPWHDWFTLADHSERLSKAFELEVDPKAQELLLAAI